MTIVRVFGGSFVNPAHVGTVQPIIVFDEARKIRKTVTNIFDATGKNLMLSCETTSSTDYENSRTAVGVKIDNELHAEIVAAIREGRDAKTSAEIEAMCTQD